MLERGWSLDQAEGCYLAPRQDSHSGSPWPGACERDAGQALRRQPPPEPFCRPRHRADLGRAQQCAVIRADLGTLPAFHLLVYSATAGYMWDCLLDAMAEFGGRPVGLEALQRAEGPRADRPKLSEDHATSQSR